MADEKEQAEEPSGHSCSQDSGGNHPSSAFKRRRTSESDQLKDVQQSEARSLQLQSPGPISLPLVNDMQIEVYKNPYTLSLQDEVWKLEKIVKDGAFCECLIRERIYTVKDFLIRLSLDQAKLRNVLGAIGMSNDIWNITVAHAQTCILEKEVYFYSPSWFENKIGVAFDVVGRPIGHLSGPLFITSDKFSEPQKDEAVNLTRLAFDNWEEVKKFDDETFCLNWISHLCTSQFPSNLFSGVVDPNKASSSRASYIHSNPYEVESGFGLGMVPMDDIREHPLRSPYPDRSFTYGRDFTANPAVIGDSTSNLFGSSWPQPPFEFDMDYNDNGS